MPSADRAEEGTWHDSKASTGGPTPELPAAGTSQRVALQIDVPVKKVG